MQIAFGRVRRKTEPTGSGAVAVIFLKLTVMVRLGMQIATPLYPPLSRGQVSTPQNRTYRPGAATVVFSKIDSHDAVRNADHNPPLSPLIKGVGEYTAKPHLPGKCVSPNENKYKVWR